MRRFLGICAVLLLLVGTVEAQRKVVRLTRYEGERITGVTASSGFDVYLVQSNETKAVVEIDEALEENLRLTLNNGIIQVDLSSSSIFRMRDPVLKLTVYLPTVTQLKGSGAAEFHSSGSFSTNSAEITLSGAAELNSLDIQTRSLKLTCSGASEASIRGETGNLDLRASGASDVELNLSCETATINVSGASDVELRGAADQAVMTVSGGSDLEASQFAVRRLTVTASGASEAEVWAVDELKAHASSASSIRYKGTPTVFNNQSSSAGSVRKMN